MNAWIESLAELIDAGESCMLLTVAEVRGSAPREVGAKMIVTARETIGTIGGGQLEYKCSQIAFDKIRNGQSDRAFVRKFPLGTNCGQCCGGVVEVLFEFVSSNSAQWLKSLQHTQGDRQPVAIATSLENSGRKFLISASGCEFASNELACPANLVSVAQNLLATDDGALQEGGFLLEPVRESQFHIAVFGAGHVGAATVDVLARLDSRIRWIDGRKNVFPNNLPANITAIDSADPAREVLAMPVNSYYLIMTHSHPLDLEICARVLRRNDVAYCGLIGSIPKRRRFERLLHKQGLTDDALRRLTCPIGIAGIDGKKPAEIALAAAAEILQTRDAMQRQIGANKLNIANVHVI